MDTPGDSNPMFEMWIMGSPGSGKNSARSSTSPRLSAAWLEASRAGIVAIDPKVDAEENDHG